MIHVTRRETFNSAHKVWRPDWSDEKNTEVFGRCANPNWHGHNYELFVTIKGDPNPETGFVIDLKQLSKLIKEQVCDKFDHRNLNLDVPYFKGMMVSTENISIIIWNILFPYVKELGATLHCIKLYETENNFVEYFG
jgi:6-pyruvoyltetrahydropterin/6-carboxytetrahydropterin synthase